MFGACGRVERTILHCDMNNFYASVECLHNPDIREKPVAVCGNPELRHGIVLAKNMLAKQKGVTTGEPIWQAKQKCPDLVLVPPHFDWYLYFSKLARQIYSDFTDQVESFGLDECWLDVTGSVHLYGDGKAIADHIRHRIKQELGLTVSVGVSYNKIFAKLGSDYQKPDATTVITRENYRQIVWPLPVEELLYVGKATKAKLNRLYIHTIGDLARQSPDFLEQKLGKNGVMLWTFANGWECSPVVNCQPQPKSVGNSTTTPKDLVHEDEVRITLYALAESVAERLREQGMVCDTVKIHIRDRQLLTCERQCKLPVPTNLSTVIANTAFALFKAEYPKKFAIRSLGVQATGLFTDHFLQTSLWPEVTQLHKAEALEQTVDTIRRRFGHYAVQRGIMLTDRRLAINPKEDHIIHPVAFVG